MDVSRFINRVDPDSDTFAMSVEIPEEIADEFSDLEATEDTGALVYFTIEDGKPEFSPGYEKGSREYAFERELYEAFLPALEKAVPMLIKDTDTLHSVADRVNPDVAGLLAPME